MARNVANSVENNFTRGLISEASGLNFPENACTDTDNCFFELTGRVRRRKAIDFESGYTTKTVDRTGSAIATYLWRNVAGDGNTTLFVVQIGSTLYFYNVTNTQALSAGALSTTINLASYQPVGAPSPKPVECQFADGNGVLFVTHPYCEALYISYNTGTQTATANTIAIYMRDFAGDTADPQSRTDQSRTTTTLGGMNVSHYYNLLNQGWNTTNLTAWDTARTDMPNNIDVMWLYKNSSEAFDTTLIDKMFRGNTPAPNGHFIVSVFDQNRDSASGLSGTTRTTLGTARMSTCAFYAGRIFYGGLQYVGYAGNIYFSQIIEPGSTYEFGRCYQLQDPTAEDLFDLLPDDGGVISIPEAGTIMKLWATEAGLVAFASNGVWVVTGSKGIGFTANDYTARRISTVKTISATSFVDINGYPCWWTADGIYMLVPDQSGAAVSVQSLTDKTILTWYQAIPLNSKKTARGFFNNVTKRVQWAYKSTDAGTPEESYAFDRILNFNVLTGAFNPWSVPITNACIHGVVVIDNVGGNISEDQVINDTADTIVDDSANNVTTFTSSSLIVPKFKYLCSYPNSGSYKFTIATEATSGFKDWLSYDAVGLDFSSYIVSGYKIHGQAIKKFEANYVFVYSQTQVGSYYFQTYRDFASSALSGQWSTRQKVSISDSTKSIIKNRLKTRGQGTAMQFKISSVTDSDFDIVGWGTYETGNQAP